MSDGPLHRWLRAIKLVGSDIYLSVASQFDDPMPVTAWNTSDVPFREHVPFKAETLSQLCLASKAADQCRVQIGRFVHAPILMAFSQHVKSGYLPTEQKTCRCQTVRTQAGST
jgi:hypothetical protein